MCVGAGAYSFRNRMSVAENSTLIYITGYKNSVLKSWFFNQKVD